VALARAIVFNPRILLMDEPLSALDKKLREQMQTELRQLQRSVGITFILVTHDQEEALTMSDRIGVMNAGRLLQVGPPREIYNRPVNRFVADFIGEANLLGCEIEAIEGENAKVRLGPVALTLPARGLRPGVAKLAVRPNRLCIGPAGTANTLPGLLDKVTYVGSHLEFMISTDLGDVFAVTEDVNAAFSAGQSIGIGFPAHGPVLIGE